MLKTITQPYVQPLFNRTAFVEYSPAMTIFNAKHNAHSGQKFKFQNWKLKRLSRNKERKLDE